MVATMPHKGVVPRLLSPAIWGRLPVHLWHSGVGGRYFFDDFLNVPQILDGDSNVYAAHLDTGVTAKQGADNRFGTLVIAGNDADNDEGYLQTGGNAGGLITLRETGQERTAFECRVKKSSVADNAVGFFVGLMQEGSAAAEALVADTAAVADKDYIGFHVDNADGDSIDFVFRTAGQTAQVPISGVSAMAADTFIKLGFLLDPNRPPSRRISVFVNGVEYETTYVTQTQIEAATFPDGEELALTLLTRVGTAAEAPFTIDWWAVGEEEG